MNRKISSARTAIGRWTLAGSAFALAVGGWSVAAVPASASPAGPHTDFSSFSFTSGNGAITAGGHKWEVEVVTSDFGTNIAGFAVAISTPHLGGTEQHSWGTVVPSSDVSVSSSGVMTINTRSAVSPIATLKLTFKPTGHKTTSAQCSTGSEENFTGTFSGSVSIATQLKGLKLKSTNLKFTGTNTLTALGSCLLAPCSFSAWDSSTSGSDAFAGGMRVAIPGQRTFGNVAITNVVSLPGKPDFFRDDSFIVTTAPAPKFSKSTKSLSVSSGNAGLVTGAATLAHAKATSSLNSNRRHCKDLNQKYNVSGTEYTKATYEPSKPFEAHTILNGVVKVKTHGTCDFEIVTVKRA